MEIFEMNKWQNPLLTLGERCVAFAENELNDGVKEEFPGSYTSPRIREYFNICTRKINGMEVLVNLRQGNWCAASASFCLKNSLLPDEEPPHGYRLGVVEIVSDLQANGLWHTVQDVLQGKYSLKVGDVIVFDRSQPGKPETAWWRHIGRVHSLTSDGFKCISGNSGGCWKISSHKLTQNNLLGFGQYPSINDSVGVPTSGIDWSSLDVTDLAPMTDTGSDLTSDDFFEEFRCRHPPK
jgi:hypothetical protein